MLANLLSEGSNPNPNPMSCRPRLSTARAARMTIVLEKEM